MNIKLAAIAIAIFSVLIIVITIQIYRRNKLPTRVMFMWIFIWLSIGVFALFPKLLDGITNFVNMTIRINFILTSAIFILFLITFYTASKVSIIALKLTRLTQEIAILNYELNKLRPHEEAK